MAVTSARIQLRRGTAAEWTASNPTLATGEPGVETDTGKWKIGNGSTAWTSLAYASGATGATGPQGPTGATGPQGTPGSSFTYKGDWSSGTAYSTGDVVLYSSQTYIALQGGTNKNPASQTAYWATFPIIGNYFRTQAPCGWGSITYQKNAGTSGCTNGTTVSTSAADAGFVSPVWTTGADNNPVANPQGNFALKAGSPLIDIGYTSNYPATDILGVTRYVGSAPDVGAYEYGG